jgi:phosphoribosyl-ATP pyrophosphohydrolase
MSDMLPRLEGVLRSRREALPEGSYSAALFRDGERLQRKIMEEAFEVCLELGRERPDAARIAEESADLLFHLLVGLVSADVSITDVTDVLEARQR